MWSTRRKKMGRSKFFYLNGIRKAVVIFTKTDLFRKKDLNKQNVK